MASPSLLITMRFTYKLLLLFAFISINVATELGQLNAKSFASEISHGVWILEFYSPYCGHCLAFKPIWEEVVEKHGSDFESKGVQMAQVNCIESADLCSEVGIDRYPTIKVYKNSQVKDQFKGKRDIESFLTYAKSIVDTYGNSIGETTSRHPIYNMAGTNFELTDKEFIKTETGPWFIKFYAPWCTHCKQLAPTWEELASKLKGHVNIASVNCDLYKSICSKNKVRGYPTLKFFQNGQEVEYTSRRDVDALLEFAEKALKADLQKITLKDLPGIETEDEIAFVLLANQESHKEFFYAANSALSKIIGLASFYQSSDVNVRQKFGAASDSPALVVLKKGRYALTHNKDTLENWVESQKYPVIVEMYGSLYDYVMENEKLVVLGIFSNVNSERLKEDKHALEIIALNYLDKGVNGILETPLRISEKVLQERKDSNEIINRHQAIPREVIFAWLDGSKWGSFAKSHFNVEHYRLPAIIISDGLKFEYYDQDVNKSMIEINTENVFSTLRCIMEGEIRPKSTKGRFMLAGIKTLYTWNAFTSTIFGSPFISIMLFSTLGGVVYFLCCRERRTTRGAKFD